MNFCSPVDCQGAILPVGSGVSSKTYNDKGSAGRRTFPTVGNGMVIKHRTLFSICIACTSVIAASPTSADIYEDAIPHLEACISLLREKGAANAPSEPGQLRETCPTLTYFLTYDPLSEIDPPLDNQSSLLQLQQVVELLKARQRGLNASKRKIKLPPEYPEQASEASKPFRTALGQWMQSKTYQGLHHIESISGLPATHIKTQHSAYIFALNAGVGMLLAVIAGFVILGITRKMEKKKAFGVNTMRHTHTVTDINHIAGLPLQNQIPACVDYAYALFKQSNTPSPYQTRRTNKLLNLSADVPPGLQRYLLRLQNLQNSLLFGSKAPSGDDMQRAINLVRKIEQGVKTGHDK